MFSDTLLVEDKVSVIASDCHNLKGRSPDLFAGIEHAISLIGQQQASTLVKASLKRLLTIILFTKLVHICNAHASFK
jgi:protein-tyrosine phosphatase